MEGLIVLSQLFVVVGLLLVLLELIVGIEAGFDFVLIGSILLISGFAGIWTDSYIVALVLASILSVVYIGYGRKLIKQRLIFSTQQTNIDKLIGKRGRVLRQIAPGSAGSIQIDDEEWRARSQDTLKPQDEVIVLSVEGVTLEVAKA